MKNRQLHREIKAGGRLRGITGRNGMSVTGRRVRGRLRLQSVVYPQHLFRAYIDARNAMEGIERRVFWEDGTSALLEDDPLIPELEKTH